MIDAAMVKAIFGGGTLGTALPVVMMFSMFTPQEEYLRHVADSARGFILDTVERASQEPEGGYKDSLCRTLHETIAELCAASPTDSICVDREMYIDRANC